MRPNVPGPNGSDSDSDRGVCLLSLDAGMNGIPTLLILKSLLEAVLEQENERHQDRGEAPREGVPKLSDYFDLMGGSGSGGVIALMLGRLGMSIDDAINEYVNLLKDVFLSGRSFAFGSALVKRYRSRALKDFLQGLSQRVADDANSPLFQDNALECCKAFVCARNGHNMNANIPFLFQTYPSIRPGPSNCAIWEAAYATLATPDIFEPISVGREQPFIGSIGCSNPTKLVLEEAATELKGRKIASIVSIGTGHPNVISLTHNSLMEVAVKMTKDCENTHEGMVQLCANHTNLYHRLNVEQGLQLADHELLANSAEVESHTNAYLSSATVQQQLRDVARSLVQAVGKVYPDRLLSAPPPARTGYSLFITPPPPSQLFTGRAETITVLEQYLLRTDTDGLSQQRRFVIYGLGGSGKTQIALRFIQMHSSRQAVAFDLLFLFNRLDRFTKMYLIDASSTRSIITALETIGLAGDLPDPTFKDTLGWLSRLEDNWLLLFDNADDTSVDLHKFFPPCNHGNILITSRSSHSSNYALQSNYRIDGMDPEEGASLLLLAARQNLSIDNEEIVQTLSSTLGYLPLALVQCGAYIAASAGTLSFQGYLQLFTKRRKELLSRRPKPAVDTYEHTVYTTWDISYNSLQANSQALLDVCSFLHHDGITMGIFARAVENVTLYPMLRGESFEPGVTFLQRFYEAMNSDLSSNGFEPDDGFALNEAFLDLLSYSLMQPGSEGSLSIHPLVRSWCQDRGMREERRGSLLTAQAVISLSADNELDEASLIHRRLLLPHLEAIVSISTYLNQNIPAEVAKPLTGAFDAAGRYAIAESLWLDIIPSEIDRLGAEHRTTLNSQSSLALAYLEQGRTTEAERLLLATLEIQKRGTGSDQHDAFLTMARLASTYRRQGRYAEALELEAELLAKQKNVLGDREDIEAIQITMHNLALTYNWLGQFDHAERIYLQVLRRRERNLGSTHLLTLQTLSRLVDIYTTRGQYTAAEELSLRLYERYARALGPTHPETLMSMNNLAATYAEQGQYAKAEGLHREVLNGRRVLLGPGHHSTLMTMNNLAHACTEQGKYDEAEQCHKEALSLRRELLGPTHLHTLMSMVNLAFLHERQGKLKDADELATNAVQLSSEHLGAEHPITLSSMSILAWIAYKQGRTSEAEERLLSTLPVQTRVYGRTHYRTLRTMDRLAIVYEAQGRGDEAEQLRASYSEPTALETSDEGEET